MKRAMAAGLGVMLMVVGQAWAGDYTSKTITVGVRKNMEATLFVPKGPGPFATILQMHTSGGIQEADRGYCAALAREGYICIAPAFLRAHGITNPEARRAAFTTEARAILEDFREIILNELQSLPQARKGAVGVIGFSNGGYFAARMAATGKVRAAVSYYGTFTGANTDKNLDWMRATWHAGSSPLLILAGRSDVTIGMEAPLKLEAIIKAVGAPYELKVYPDAGHNFERSNATGLGNAAAAVDAWQRTLAFLRAHGV